jgi:hypothetical protein
MGGVGYCNRVRVIIQDGRMRWLTVGIAVYCGAKPLLGIIWGVYAWAAGAYMGCGVAGYGCWNWALNGAVLTG